MNSDYYSSVGSVSQGYYQEKGSKFYAIASAVGSETEVRERLDALKKKYHDARHYCYAFVLRPEAGRESVFRASDDGEPAHSAGEPILGQIRSLELYDTLVVVVRYFGGTKLGVGGLVHAYRSAAADALRNNQVVQRVYQAQLAIRFAYAATSEVQRAMHRYDASIVDQSFGQDCFYRWLVPRSKLPEITRTLTHIGGVTLL